MTDRDVTRDRGVPVTQAGGRFDEDDEVVPAAPGVEDVDEIGAGVSVGDGTLAGPAIGGSLNPPASGVVGEPNALAGLVAPTQTTPEPEAALEDDREERID